MLKTKFIGFLLMALTMTLVACSDDDNDRMPQFSAITITPEKEVYKVGDVITCSITETKAPGDELKEASYWWYASWWFTNPDLTADFQEFDENKVNTSSEITLTQAGEVTLYFFGRLEYPQFDFQKVEIGKTITVTE